MNNFKVRAIKQQWGIIKHQPPSTPNHDIKSIAIFSSLLDNFSAILSFFPFVSRNGTKRFFRYLSTIGRMAMLALGVSERRGLQIKNASNDAQNSVTRKSAQLEINRFMIGFCTLYQSRR